MALLAALGLRPGDCIAVVGAGGKTTLCWRLAQALTAGGEYRAIFTTTTRIWQPARGVFDRLCIGPAAAAAQTLNRAPEWHTACLAAAIDGASDATPVAGAGMPTVHTKLMGFAPDEICALRSSTRNASASILVEADGARGLHIKAPGEEEPVIPQCADVVCVLVSLDAIGRPLDERVAHRADRLAQLTQTMPGSVITPSLIITLLAHPSGGMKGIPQGARAVAVLTQRDEQRAHPDAPQIAAALLECGFHHAVTIAPRAARPVLLAY